MFLSCVGLLIRSGLILGSAAIFLKCARRYTPANRHRILLASLACLLLWPLCSSFLPEISLLSWIPAGNLDGTVTVHQTASSIATGAARAHTVNWIFSIWLAGVFLMALRLGGSYGQAGRLLRHTVPFADEQWHTILQRQCRRLGLKRVPELRVHPDAAVPFACRLWRPCIVLPADCTEWHANRRRAVLLHELAHIKRRDLFSQLFASLTAALWWFQPLVWVICRNLRRESEHACDVEVLASGMSASAYAGELLTVARQYRAPRVSSAAAAVLQHGELEQRLHAILAPPLPQLRRFPLAAAVLLTVLTFTASAVTFSPETMDQPGGHPMKHTLISGLLISAGLAATSPAQASASEPQGRAVAPVSSSTVPQAEPVKQPLQVKGEVAEANLIKKVQPVYPVSAKKAGRQGVVQIKAVITKEGVPEDLQVTSSPGDDLSQSALDAVRQWRYRPVLLNGQPVGIVTEIVVNYTLTK